MNHTPTLSVEVVSTTELDDDPNMESHRLERPVPALPTPVNRLPHTEVELLVPLFDVVVDLEKRR
jgi:hypothetical protein